MVFAKKQQPNVKEQSTPEIENVIEKMKEVSQEKMPPKPDFVVKEDKVEELEEIPESIKEQVKKPIERDYFEIPEDEVSIDEILKIPVNKRTTDQHAELVKHFGVSEYLKMVGPVKEEPQVRRSEDISTTYKGVRATKRVITQLIIGNTIVREETQDMPVHANITVE